MASIRKLNTKNGLSYEITVSQGRNSTGEQIRRYMTYSPPANMTPRQIDKELQRVAFEFEREITQGFAADNRQTFSQYAAYVLDLKERSGNKHRTVVRYRELLERINPAIGHIKLQDLRPQHLNALYKNLGEQGIRGNADKAKAKKDISALVSEKKLTRAALAAAAGVSANTVTKTCKGEIVDLKTAEAIAAALGAAVGELFTVTRNTAPLSNKTIIEHHRLISTIFSQAEKEMLVQFNVAAKATPPKIDKREAETFQLDEVEQIRDGLEGEPLKWKLATHLLLITGCRRGEIMGLKWDRIDWNENQIKIDTALLYAADVGIYEDTTKTNTVRYIRLPEQTMTLLKEYKIWHDDLREKNGDQWKESGFVFVQDNGEHMHPDSLTDWLKKFSGRHGILDVHPHKFRHTMASILYFNGIDSITISKRLGHAKVSTTTDIYSHIIKQADAQASDCIGGVLLKGGKGLKK